VTVLSSLHAVAFERLNRDGSTSVHRESVDSSKPSNSEPSVSEIDGSVSDQSLSVWFEMYIRTEGCFSRIQSIDNHEGSPINSRTE
jgi:hypothetical protein